MISQNINETQNAIKKGEVEKYFKKNGVNCAPYAYKLFRVKKKEGKDSNDMKNARSLFMKKLNHEKNDNGGIYSFTSREKNRLQNLISNGQLSETIDSIVKETIKENLNSIENANKTCEYCKPAAKWLTNDCWIEDGELNSSSLDSENVKIKRWVASSIKINYCPICGRKINQK